MKYSSILWSTVIALVAYAPSVSAVPKPALSGTHSARAKHIPWSGSWWPMASGELVLGWDDGAGRRAWSRADVKAFDQCISSYTAACTKLLSKMAGKDGKALSPMMKFDFAFRQLNERIYGPGEAPSSAYSHAAKWDLENHTIGDNSRHRHWEAREFAGKCIGWALSTFDYPEPTKSKTIEGVVFRPADIKGILAALYNGAQFFVPEDAVVGNAFYESTGTAADYKDVLPLAFLRALSLTIDRGLLLEADLEPGSEVWNYPIFKYDLKWKQTRPGVVGGEVTIFYADDDVHFDAVFSTNSRRPDIQSRKLPFELKVPAKWDGDLRSAKEGRWIGTAIDEHPDALILWLEKDWRRAIYQYRESQMKLEVNFQLLKRINVQGRGWVPVVDMILDQYYRS